MFRGVLYITILVCILFSTQSLAQTTQPANRDVPAAWQELVSGLAKTLAEESDETAAINALSALLPEDVIIQKFGAPDAESRIQLRQQTGGLSVVSARPYVWPMDSFASDLSTDVRAFDAMPETLRKQFTPRDDVETKRANTTAQQWVSAVFRPTAGQPVAMIVLWESSKPTEAKLPVFILIRGRPIEEGRFRITHITFGDVSQALN